MTSQTTSSKSPRYLRTARYAARVDADGTVRIWDDVADHYTTCHSLTAAQIRYIRSRAR